MRLLWLKSDLLLPLDKGGKLRTWHLLRHLAARHEITYLAFIEPDTPQADIDGMKQVAADVETIRRSDARKGSWRFYADAALHLLDPLPYAVGKYRSAAFRRRLHQLLEQRSFDVIVCDFLFPAVNLPHRLPCPAVIFTHNVESEIWRRYAETADAPLARWLYSVQHARMMRYEERALRRFDGVLAVSNADRSTLSEIYPGAIHGPVHVVPTGVDTEYFTAAASHPQSRELVFTGSMDWLPNEDAMQFFCHEVLPRVRDAEPGATLSIVGRSPTPAVSRLAAEPGVRVTGRVDDVRPYMHDAALYVVPLRIGGGTRLKIFEAMAMGKAVVSTSIGAEGLPVTDNHHLVIADGAESFAREIVRLLRDSAERRRLETAARALVVERYDWSAVAGELETALVRIAARTPVADPAATGPSDAARSITPSASGDKPAMSHVPDLEARIQRGAPEARPPERSGDRGAPPFDFAPGVSSAVEGREASGVRRGGAPRI